MSDRAALLNRCFGVAGAFILCAGVFQAAAKEISVIPLPARMEPADGSFALTLESKVQFEAGADEARREAEYLASVLRPATGFLLPVEPAAAPADHAIFFATSGADQGEEGYALSVAPRHVTIRAAGPAGWFYGCQTLRQLLPVQIFRSEADPGFAWTVPCVEIEDVPAYPWRGMHLDVGRHFLPAAFVKRFIDLIALHKMNTLHWHLTEDQGWRIEIRKYPKLTEVGAWRDETVVGHIREYRKNKIPFRYDGIRHGGFYTQEQIRDIVAHAATRHVTIVPEIDMPGHMQAAVASYPELGCTDSPVGVKKEWGISAQILNPEDSTIQFMQHVLTEVMELFPGPFIHIGGDEARKTLWEKSPHIQQLREERGLNDMHEMQSWFIRQMDAFLSRHGRRLIGWDEIVEGGLAENATVMWWRDRRDTGTELALRAIRDGHDVVAACNSTLYFDHYQSKDKENEPLAIGGLSTLEDVYGFYPDLPGLTREDARHILGAQGQLWTEYMKTPEHVEYMAFPRVCALAEVVWTRPASRDYDAFVQRLIPHLQRLDGLNVNFRRLHEPAPAQAED